MNLSTMVTVATKTTITINMAAMMTVANEMTITINMAATTTATWHRLNMIKADQSTRRIAHQALKLQAISMWGGVDEQIDRIEASVLLPFAQRLSIQTVVLWNDQDDQGFKCTLGRWHNSQYANC